MFSKLINSVRSSVDRLITILTVKKQDNANLSCENLTGDLQPSQLIQHYGFCSNLPEGTRCLAINQFGLAENSITIATRSDHQPVNLGDGDVVIYDNKNNKITLTQGKIVIDAQLLEINANDVNITGSLKASNIKTTGDVIAGTVSLQHHIHTVPTPGNPATPTSQPV